MLSRRIPDSFVCLRCRLSLASRGRARLDFRGPSTRSRLAVTNLPTRSYGGWTALQEASRQDDGPPGEERREHRDRASRYGNGARDQDARLHRHRGREGSDRRAQDPSKATRHLAPPVYIRPTDYQMYQSKGQRLRPRHESLPINILGQPAHAIVMRDVGKWGDRYKLKKMDPEQPRSSASTAWDISHLCDSINLDVPTSDEVVQNIHELRPTDTKILLQSEFDRLKRKIMRCFTKAQLATYIRRTSLEAKKTQSSDSQATKPWLLRQWPWMPKTDAAGASRGPLYTGYISKSASAKEKLAVGVLRQCWELSVIELQGKLGYLDCKVADLQFNLLMLGNRKWLESISRSLFEPGTQIELVRSERLVRIVAPKAAAELILQEVDTLLSQAVTRVLDARSLPCDKLDQGTLAEVARISNSVINLDKSRSKITITWIPSREQRDRKGLEDVADVANRLLYAGLGYKQSGEATMVVQPEAYAVGGWYLQDYHSKPKMTWKDRLAQWARWTMATPTIQTRQAQPVRQLPESILPESLEAGSTPSFSSVDGWSSEPQGITRAILGHVLHRQPLESDLEDLAEGETRATGSSPDDNAGAQKGPTVGETSTPEDVAAFRKIPTPDSETRPFLGPMSTYNHNINDQVNPGLARIVVPVVPPLQSLAHLTAESKVTPTETTILIRLIPAPTNNPTRTPLPTIELTLRDDYLTGELTPQNLHAIHSVNSHDVLLPTQPVDIRLTRTAQHILPGASIAEHCPEITSFLEASDLRPEEGVLSTPPRLQQSVRLPRRVIAGNSSVADEPAEAVEYVFAGLEMRRTVAADVDGWRLVYTSVEAGQGGGRRAELALEGVRMGESVSVEDSTAAFEDPFTGTKSISPGAEADQEKSQPSKAEFIATLAKLVMGDQVKWVGEYPTPSSPDS